MDSGEVTDFTLNLIILTLCSASLGFHCAYVNAIKSPQMSVWFNFFHSGRQLNWISPKWLSISCLCVTSGAGCWGIQTHSPIYLTPISHLAQSVWLSIFEKHKSCNVIGEPVLFLHASSCALIDCFKTFFCVCLFVRPCRTLCCGYSCFCVREYYFYVSPAKHIQYLNSGIAARWGRGLVQACQWHSIAQQLLVAVTPWPAFPLHHE